MLTISSKMNRRFFDKIKIVGLGENPWYWNLWPVHNVLHVCLGKLKSLHSVWLCCSFQALL